MSKNTPGFSRRQFLTTAGAVFAGGIRLGSAQPGAAQSSDSERTRPAEYRWDLVPEHNHGRRAELEEYVDDLGPLIEDHPAFEYATDRDRDDHGIDFEALKLFRATNYAQYDAVTEPSFDQFVEAFNDDSFEAAKTTRFLAARVDAPREWDREAWRNADSFGESLDYAHSLLISIDNELVGNRTNSFTATLREAYRRYHPTYEPLAWSFTMDIGPRDGEQVSTGDDGKEVGLVYSAEADELRAFALGVDPEFAQGNSRQLHPRIEEWSVVANPSVWEPTEPSRLDHPLLFHTEGWNRQGLGFAAAKARVTEMVNHVATDPVGAHLDRDGRIVLTTGFAVQLTRTLLEYNQRDVEFMHIWNLATVMELARARGGNYVFDVAPESNGYDGSFDGNFAVYEIAYDSVMNLVNRDGSRRLDRFGEVYGLGTA